MKIAFDHQIFSYQSFGGISRYYKQLAHELFYQQQDVSIFAGVYRNEYVNNLPESIVKGIKIKKYPPKTGIIFKCINHGFSEILMKMNHNNS
jgi:hypothetical protein